MEPGMWLRDMAVFFLFMTAVQNVLPSRQYRGTVRFFLGLLMLLVLGRPLLALGGLEERFLASLEDFTLEAEKTAADDGRELFEGFQEDYLYGAYERELESRIGRFLADRGVGAARVSVTLGASDDISLAEIRIRAPSGGEEMQTLLWKAKKELSDVYQLDPGHIIVEIQE